MRGFTIRLESPGFGKDPGLYAEFVRNGLANLTMANEYAYRSNPSLPSIYEAGVVYRREPPGNEQFKDVVSVLNDGHGDCEDLSCSVSAYRRVRLNEHATPTITWKRLGKNRWLYHITVLRSDGSREDPSRVLGMNREPGEWRQEGALWVYRLFPGRQGLTPKPVPVRPKEAA